jgi:drug/metabolite transporter (DMT)-like permease
VSQAIEATRSSSPALGRRCVLAAAVLWSLSGVVTKSDVLRTLDAPTIAFYRSLFAGLALLPFVPRSRWRFRASMLPAGLIFGAMIGLYIAAIRATTAANAIFLQCSATLWMVPLSALLLRERPDRRSLLGIAVAAPGIAGIVLFGHGGTAVEWLGVACGLASGLAYACVVIAMRGLRDLDPVWLSGINNLGGALALGAWMLATSGPIALPSPPQLGILLAFGVIQMAIPYALFARGLREIGAAEAGLIALAEPILNPLWVAFGQGERPSGPTVVGGLFLLAGVALRYLPTRRRPLPVPEAAEPPAVG